MDSTQFSTTTTTCTSNSSSSCGLSEASLPSEFFTNLFQITPILLYIVKRSSCGDMKEASTVLWANYDPKDGGRVRIHGTKIPLTVEDGCKQLAFLIGVVNDFGVSFVNDLSIVAGTYQLGIGKNNTHFRKSSTAGNSISFHVEKRGEKYFEIEDLEVELSPSYVRQLSEVSSSTSKMEHSRRRRGNK